MGKPLISDAAMHGMYDTMQQLRAAKQKPGWFATLSRGEHTALREQPESLAAAMLSQMHRRDTLLVQGRNPLLQVALDAAFADKPAPRTALFPGDAEECAAAAAGMSLQQKLTGKSGGVQPTVVALLHALPPLTGVLRLMEEQDLSLILVVAGGEPEGRSDAQRRLHSTKVPVLPVDHADAVAVCRVMQESMLRARCGWGGVIIHATAMPGSVEPMLLIEQHLRNRNVTL